MDRKRYPKNWEQIAFKIKEKAKWKCTKCGLQCLKPSDDKTKLNKSQKAKLTLTVHHLNYQPEDNRPENLVALCTSCHLLYHRRQKGSESVGQQCLFNLDDYNQ